MVKAINGIYHDGQVELNELPSNQSQPLEVIAIFLEPGETIPPELAQILIPRTPSPINPTSPKPLPDMVSRLAKLQEFITNRAQQQPSPEAAAFFERFQEHFDAEREPERKLFHQHEQL